MNKLIKEEGLASLVKIIFVFEKNFGKKKLLDIIANNPSNLLELIDEQYILDKNSKEVLKFKTDVKEAFPIKWSKVNAKKHLDRYKLTHTQRVIMGIMLNSKNKASLDNLKEGCKKKGIDVGTGSVIGGSLAGLSKKSVSYGIPEIYETFQDKDGFEKYGITPEALDFVESYLN